MNQGPIWGQLMKKNSVKKSRATVAVNGRKVQIVGGGVLFIIKFGEFTFRSFNIHIFMNACKIGLLFAKYNFFNF